MTSDPSNERRVSRLENDTESIYELVGDLRGEFVEFRAEFRDFRSEFDTFRADTSGRFDRVEETLSEVLRRLPEPT